MSTQAGDQWGERLLVIVGVGVVGTAVVVGRGCGRETQVLPRARHTLRTEPLYQILYPAPAPDLLCKTKSQSSQIWNLLQLISPLSFITSPIFSITFPLFLQFNQNTCIKLAYLLIYQLLHINVYLLQEYNGLISAFDTHMCVRSIASFLFELCSDIFTRNIYVCFSLWFSPSVLENVNINYNYEHHHLLP